MLLLFHRDPMDEVPQQNTDFDFGALGASVTLSPKKKKKKSRKRSKRDKSMPKEVAESAPPAEPSSKRRRNKKRKKTDKKAKKAAASHVAAQDDDDGDDEEGNLTAATDVPAASGMDEIPLFRTDPSTFIDVGGNIVNSDDGK